MPFNAIQREFLTNFVIRQPKMKELILRRDDMSAIPPGAATADPGLEARLAGVGRVIDSTLPDDQQAAEQAARKEEHLRDILQRDEDGLNAGQIVAKLAPVTEDQLKDARLDPTDPANVAKIGDITTARALLKEQREMQLFVGERLLDLRDDGVAAGSAPHDAMHLAITKLAKDSNQKSLSHHISRHGPQTTVDQHVARVATGYAADDPLSPTMVPGATGTYTTAAGTTASGATATPVSVTIPHVDKRGPTGSKASSRTGSGEAGLYMVEDALSKVQQSTAHGNIDTGERYTIDTQSRSDDAVFGEGVEVNVVTPLGGGAKFEADPTGAAISVSGDLSDGSRAHRHLPVLDQPGKNAVIKQRAEAIMIDREVRSAKVIVEVLSDGSFRTVTSFPDASVAADAFTGPGGAKDLDQERLDANLAALAKLTLEAKTARDAFDAETLARAGEQTTRHDAATDAIRQSIASVRVMGAPDDLNETLRATQKAAHELDIASAKADTLAQSEIDVTVSRTKFDDFITANTAGLPALLNTRALAKTAHEADKASKPKAQDFQRAHEAYESMKAALEGNEKLRDDADAILADLATRKAAATIAKTTAQAAFDDAKAAAATATAMPEQIQACVDAGRAMDAAFAALKELRNELQVMENLANALESQVSDMGDQQSGGTGPSDSDIALERAARTDALTAALAKGGGDLDKAKAEWTQEIDGVDAMFKQDADERAARLGELKKERAAAVTLLADLMKQHAAALKTLGALDPATADPAILTNATAAAATLDNEVKAQRARGKTLKSRVAQNTRDDRSQQRLDAANIAVARAVLETTAAAVEAAKAEADDAPDKAARRKAAQVKLAGEALRTAERDKEAAVIEAREARNALRLADLFLARTDANLTEMRATILAARQAGPLSPAQGKMESETIPKVADTRIEAVARRDAARIARDTAAAAFITAQKAVSDASRAVKALG